ncbi:MAG: methyltransferase domain-containing protein, partial [Chitinophagales bacterium]|nr:methyltransferase domain-containing protein [Chitinophagales bacterium]
FSVANVDNMPFENEHFDIIVSGLALNFFPNVNIALSEIKRVLKPDGIIAAYVWDYSGRMDFLRCFWDAAFQIDPHSQHLDEGKRFPICNADNLTHTFHEAGFDEVKTSFLDIDTTFKDFDDFWNPFLGGQGPAPSYLASLNSDLRKALKNNLKDKLHRETDGSIKLLGRAVVVKALLM